MPAALWAIADELCSAEGALVAEYEALAAAEVDYRDRCRAHRRQAQIQQARQTHRQALWSAPGSPTVPSDDGGNAWPDKSQRWASRELMQVISKLVRILGRRDAIGLIGCVLAAVGLSDLDADECTRLAHAVRASHRVDAQVVNNLAMTLAQCKRLEDTLGPCEVLDTVVAQHEIVHRLLEGCPEQLRKALSLVDSTMASAIGGYLIDMGNHTLAQRYFHHARRAGYDASNPACAAYAAANASFAACLRRDTPTGLDTAAAARSLAARTDDAQLKALAEQMAAGAYALDGQYGPCMAACDRAHEFLASSNGSSPESLAYWVHHGALDSNRSTLFSLLGRPRQAVEAAFNAQAQFNQTHVQRYTRCQIRLGHALILDGEISEAARVLGDAAAHAHLSPRLTQELHATRALMQPWATTHAVTTLDAQLHTYGLRTCK
jgi:hypothetical protein